MPNTTRPPRPIHVENTVLTEVARSLGMKTREIVNVEETPEGRRVTTHDGSVVIIAETPDAIGQTGVLAVAVAGGPPVPRGMRAYVAPGRAPVELGEAWTVADLDLEAGRLVVPGPTSSQELGRPSLLPWVHKDGDPWAQAIRARAAWLHHAAEMEVTPQACVRQCEECGRFRDIVIGSRLLSGSQVNAL
ncbi:hypothetical protein [Streptosporangium sp. NPDC006007]|uniref:hypothetical protein n=1 Tax=Streptosporangium sp. NPDC006007 TaxID=3154575 RepID=UPI0033BB6396